MGAILKSIPLKIKDLDEIYVIDSFPIPMCQAIRHWRVKLLRDEGAYFGKGTRRVVFRLQTACFVNADGANRRSSFVANEL